ncbi:MAG: hypothetical protein ACI976_000346 [Aureispira sp.]|jgi:uncharacterized protein YydD (DUF2326 family)
MKLSKLYCNKSNFQNIKFNLNGMNVIAVDVKSKPRDKKNQHDLGKTKLAELIDFMLLKEINKKHFLLKLKSNNGVSIFYEHVFYLELLLNTGDYLTIRRGAGKHTKIAFALNSERIATFSPPLNWAYEEIAIKKAKGILSNYLAFDFFKNKEEYDYRKSISYSLRTQDDFRDVYKLNKFVGKDLYWKPFMFDLLGFKGNLLSLKYENDLELEKIKFLIDSFKKEYSVGVEDRDGIVAEQAIIRTNYKHIEEQIDLFNFYEQDKELVEGGIIELEDEISTLNSDAYQLNYEIQKLESSIKNKFSFEIEKIKKVFEETNLFFPEQLATDYDNLILFNKKLTTERNKILKSTIITKRKKLERNNKELLSANKKREELFAHLIDSDTFSKFKFYQKELVKVEGKLLKYQEQLDIIDKIIGKERQIEDLKEYIKSTTDKLRNIYLTTDKNEKYSDIRTTFAKYYKMIMDEDAYISWNINQNSNVEFLPPKVKDKLNRKRDTAKDEGNTYKKILCIVFDLSILTTYNEESYYRFVYHDDVLSQQDNGVKNRFLKLVYDVVNTSNLQYILSVIKSDLPFDENGKRIEFPESEVILKLNDKGPEGTLFGFEF